MGGRINGTLKAWWPLIVTIAAGAGAWGALRTEVNQHAGQIDQCERRWRAIESQVNAIAVDVAWIRGRMVEVPGP